MARGSYSGGVVNNVSRYRERIFAKRYKNGIPPDSDTQAIQGMLEEYHADGTTDARKLELKHDILMRAYFLFPHFLKKNYFFTAELFNEAIQNMTANTLIAIDLYRPGLGYLFSNYLIGYFRDAATKALRNCNVVSPSTLKQAGLEASLPFEECGDAGENPYLVSGSDEFDRGYSMQKMREGSGREYTTEDEPIRKNQRVIRGAVRVMGNAVQLDDSRRYAVAPGHERELDADERILNKQLVEWLEEAVSAEAGVLTEDERYVLIHHYGLFGHTQMKYADIAEQRKKQGRGCACSRISQINTEAVNKLRKYFYSHNVEE